MTYDRNSLLIFTKGRWVKIKHLTMNTVTVAIVYCKI
jgi:hypothetical protein